MDNGDETETISFRLTRAQRVVNPITRLNLALAGIGSLVAFMGAIVFITVRGAVAHGVWATISSPSYSVSVGLVAFGIVMMSFMVGRSILGVYVCLSKDYYINTIGFVEGRVFCGIDGIQLEIMFPSKVSRGLLRTYIISGGSCGLVVPRDAISFQELKRRIEKRDPAPSVGSQ